jgi:hypothetical protein
MINPDHIPSVPTGACGACPWVIVSELSATELPVPDGRFVRLRLYKNVEVILTRAELFAGLKRGKAVRRAEQMQRRSP